MTDTKVQSIAAPAELNDSPASSSDDISSSKPATKPAAKKKQSHRLMQLKNFHRTKSNSTSTMYVNNTLSAPDLDELLRCIAIQITRHINQDAKGGNDLNPSFEIFNEEAHPIYDEPSNTSSLPDLDDVHSLVETVFKAERLSAECGIMMLAYIERLVTLTGVQLTPSSWRRIVLSTLILASKVWEDQAVWNVDFLSVFPSMTVKDLGNLEKVLLRLLRYNVSLKASLYAKYYFELRSLAQADGRHFPLDPLDKDGSKRLEERSKGEEEKLRAEEDPSNRSKSMNFAQGGSKRPPAVLN